MKEEKILIISDIEIAYTKIPFLRFKSQKSDFDRFGLVNPHGKFQKIAHFFLTKKNRGNASVSK